MCVCVHVSARVACVFMCVCVCVSVCFSAAVKLTARAKTGFSAWHDARERRNPSSIHHPLEQGDKHCHLTSKDRHGGGETERERDGERDRVKERKGGRQRKRKMDLKERMGGWVVVCVCACVRARVGERAADGWRVRRRGEDRETE